MNHLKVTHNIMENIGYKIVDIKVLQFAIITEQLDSDSTIFDWNMKTSYSFGVEPTQRLFFCVLEILISKDEHPLIKIETQASFELYEGNFHRFIKKDGFHMPTSDVCHFTSMLYGATRGILVSKLESTSLKHIILPPINMRDVVTHPLFIPIHTPCTQLTQE